MAMRSAVLLCALAGLTSADTLARVPLLKKPLDSASLRRASQAAAQANAGSALLGAGPQTDIPLLDYLDAQVLPAPGPAGGVPAWMPRAGPCCASPSSQHPSGPQRRV